MTCLCRCSKKSMGSKEIQHTIIAEVNIATERGCLFQASITIPAQNSPKAPQTSPRALSRTLLMICSRIVVLPPTSFFSFSIILMTRLISSSLGLGKGPSSGHSAEGVYFSFESSVEPILIKTRRPLDRERLLTSRRRLWLRKLLLPDTKLESNIVFQFGRPLIALCSKPTA